MKRVFGLLAAILLALALPLTALAEKTEGTLTLLTATGSYVNGILKMPSAGEYGICLGTPDLTNDYTFSGDVKIRTMGPNPWNGVGFTVGYTAGNCFNQILVTKEMGVITRSMTPGGWGDVGVPNAGLEALTPLESGDTFHFEIAKKGLELRVKINDALVYEAVMLEGTDFFVDGMPDNVGVFNSECVLELTNLRVEDADHIYTAVEGDGGGATNSETTASPKSTGYRLENAASYPNMPVTTTTGQPTTSQPTAVPTEAPTTREEPFSTAQPEETAPTTETTQETEPKTEDAASDTTRPSAARTTEPETEPAGPGETQGLSMPLLLALIAGGAVIMAALAVGILLAIRRRKTSGERG